MPELLPFLLISAAGFVALRHRVYPSMRSLRRPGYGVWSYRLSEAQGVRILRPALERFLE